jgi:hypothetical protein
MLGVHCPKLLRVYGSSLEPTIMVQRMNKDQKFRRVRQVQKVINDERLRFDYDSVEDCSDDDGVGQPTRVKRTRR